MCALAALILGMDCFMSVTFYIAVMGVMIEVSLLFLRLQPEVYPPYANPSLRSLESPP